LSPADRSRWPLDSSPHALSALNLLLSVIATALASWAQPSRPICRTGSGRVRVGEDVSSGGLFAVLGHDHTASAEKPSGMVRLDRSGVEDFLVSPSIKSYSPVVVDLQVSDKERSEIQPAMPGPTGSCGGGSRPENGLQVQLTGKLDLRDVEQEITFPARVDLQGEWLRAAGTVFVAQPDFDTTPVKLCGETERVTDQVVVKFDFLAERAN